MIITAEEIDAFERFLDSYEKGIVLERAIALEAREHGLNRGPQPFAKGVVSRLTSGQLQRPLFGSIDQFSVLAYLRRKPHLLLPSGFDEIRIQPEPARSLLCELGKYEPTIDQERTTQLPAARAIEFMLGIHCRALSSGLWYQTARLELSDYALVLRPDTGTEPLSLSLRNILKNCRDSLGKNANAAVILLPNLWVPPSNSSNIQIASGSKELVNALRNEAKLLSDLSWQQLEDVVAEVLRSRGFEITITPRSRDGGRDIVARGEMVPGELCLLAVEVKHRPVVKLPEVRGHLLANRDFPMLLIASSGRFSAGVVREKQKPENFLRLHLRDRASIQAWIREYRDG